MTFLLPQLLPRCLLLQTGRNTFHTTCQLCNSSSGFILPCEMSFLEKVTFSSSDSSCWRDLSLWRPHFSISPAAPELRTKTDISASVSVKIYRKITRKVQVYLQMVEKCYWNLPFTAVLSVSGSGNKFGFLLMFCTVLYSDSLLIKCVS